MDCQQRPSGRPYSVWRAAAEAWSSDGERGCNNCVQQTLRRVGSPVPSTYGTTQYGNRVRVRRLLGELRIGLVAGATASMLLYGALRATDVSLARPASHVNAPTSSRWMPPLVDPIASAQEALARGDSGLVAIADADSLLLPAVTSEHRPADSTGPFRLYSRESTGLTGRAWVTFVARAIPYAAAYNAVVLVARDRSSSRS